MYRIKQLLASGQTLFHTRDLAVLWGTSNLNTLYTTVKRYTDLGILIPIQKGLYATVPPENLDSYQLGKALVHGYSYVTTETVLSLAGFIQQSVPVITFAAQNSGRQTSGARQYVIRRLADRYLFRTDGIYEKNGVLWAEPVRAVADMLYFNRQYHFDGRLHIDWLAVRAIQKEVGYI